MERKFKRRILKLAEFLATQVKREKFDLDSFVNQMSEFGGWKIFTKLEDYTKCGTTACAIGWCPVAFPNTFKLTSKGNIALVANPRCINFKAATEYFGIPKNHTDYLFTTYAYRDGHKGPKSVARRLREYVARDGRVPKGQESDY